jgi:hypothetical protein
VAGEMMLRDRSQLLVHEWYEGIERLASIASKRGQYIGARHLG